MKIHTDNLTASQVNAALNAAKSAGLVDASIIFDKLEEKGSRSRVRSFDVHLEWIGTKVKGDGRRFANTGTRGAEKGVYAATYDEWGHFLVNIFEMDPEAKTYYYDGRANFNGHTRYKYDATV